MGRSGVGVLLLWMLRVKGKLLGAKSRSTEGSLGDWFVFEGLGVVVKRGPLVTVGE